MTGRVLPFAAVKCPSFCTCSAHRPSPAPANDAALRLLHVREFLEAVDQHFPWGVPLEITAAIREELAPLEAAADAAIERTR